MDFNKETVLDELNDFEKRPNEISPVLEEYLQKIAKSGDTIFLWSKLKPLFKRKLELVLTDFYESCPTDNLPPLPNVENFKYDVLKAKILEAVDSFESAPFTIQRLCELVTNPRRHYQRADKFMRGVEKNILVVSTVEPRSPFGNEVCDNNNSSLIVNGLVSTTTMNSLQGTLTSDDNGNICPSFTTTTKSSVNRSGPLDNFAAVFSSAPCMTTSTDVNASTTSSSSHESTFQNSSLDESFNSNENNSNDVTKGDRLSENRDGQLADSAMDQGDEAVSRNSDLEEDHPEWEEKEEEEEEDEQPNYVVSSSQGEGDITAAQSHPDDSVSQSHFRLLDSVESTKTSESDDDFNCSCSPPKEDAMNMLPPSPGEQSELSESVHDCKDMSDSDSCDGEDMEQD